MICLSTIKSKINFQNTWARGLDKDDDLQPDMKTDCPKWTADLQEVSSVTDSPRCVHPFLDTNAQQIRLFADASEQAYAAVV